MGEKRMTEQQGTKQKLHFKPAAKVNERLVKEAMRGNIDAITQVIELYYQDILYFTVKKVGIQEGEDVSQQALTRIIDSLDTLKDPSKIKPWMMSIVNYTCADHVRTAISNRKHEAPEEEGSEETLLSLEEESRDFLPEEALLDGELSSLILNLIEGLPQNYADTLRMYYHQDMSYQEISEALGVKYDKVRNDMSNGRNLLKKHLENTTGTKYHYSALAAGAVPVLSQVMQVDFLNTITPQMASDVLGSALAHAKTTSAAQAATQAAATKTGVAAKVIVGSALVLAVAGAAAWFIGTTPEEAAPQPQVTSPAPAATEEASPDPEPTPTPAQAPINNIVDMIGVEEAAQLASFEANTTTEAAWQQFIGLIGASEEMKGIEPGYTYTLYVLQKQDKQLLLAAKQDESGHVQVKTQFGPQEELPVMSRIYLMFP